MIRKISLLEYLSGGIILLKSFILPPPKLIGGKSDELGNHLGNVLVTVSDRKIGVPQTGNSSLIDHYTADVVTANDYYPFGMVMQNRNTFYPPFREGFNGKERDDDAKGGTGNQIDYGMRIYDPRTGRFLSVDPISSKYPELSTYQYASNSPIDGVDEDGLEWAPTKDKEGNVAGYNWQGYNLDGNPKAGTVAEAYIKKGNFSFVYTSDAKNKTGQLNIISSFRSFKAGQGTVTSNATQDYNYTINFKPALGGMNTGIGYNVTANVLRPEEGSSESEWIGASNDRADPKGFKDNDALFKAARAFGLTQKSDAIDVVYPESIIVPVIPKGLGVLAKSEVLFAKTGSIVAETESVILRETGGLKQWLRLGPSYSVNGGFKTFGLRWGASPRYLNKIGNPFLKELNKGLRNLKIPINSWRTADPGHFHFWRQ